jgi:hypothetical protein
MLLAVAAAFLLVALIGALVLVNPWLALWVGLGLLIGLLFRAAQAWRRQVPRTSPEDDPAGISTTPRTSRRIPLLVLAGVVLVVLAVAGTAFLRSDDVMPSPESVVRAGYSLTAQLSPDDAAWTIDEKYTFGERAVDEILNDLPPPSPAPEGGLTGMALASYLAEEFGDGWQPAVDTGDPVLQRTRTTSSRTSGLTTSTHVIDLPHPMAGAVLVVPDDDSTAVLKAPRFTIVRTSPPLGSRDTLVGGGLEDVRLPILADAPAIRVESADGPLRNELFFGLANVSFVSLTGLAVGGLVSSLTAAFGGAVWGSFKRLVGRREVPEG